MNIATRALAGAALAGAATVAVVTAPALATGGGHTKYVVCHKPGTSAQLTLEVDLAAKLAHLRHGDAHGACKPQPTESTPTPEPEPTTEPTSEPTVDPEPTPTPEPTEPTETPTTDPTPEPERIEVEVTDPDMWETCEEVGLNDPDTDLWTWELVGTGEDEFGPWFDVRAVPLADHVDLTGKTEWRLYYGTPDDMFCDGEWIDLGEFTVDDEPEPTTDIGDPASAEAPAAPATTDHLAAAGAPDTLARFALLAVLAIAAGGSILTIAALGGRNGRKAQS